MTTPRLIPHLRLAALAFAAGICVADAQELGRPFLQNFALRDYHAHNQNWAAVQDAQGIMHFGNKNVVLEYDGVAWRKNVVSHTTYIRGLAIEAATGRMFVGGVDELGYFEASSTGERRFVSLLEKLSPDARDFRDIRRAYASGDGVYFVAEQQVMRWRDGAFKIWKLPNASRLQSHWVADRLHVQHPDLGLLRLDGDTFTPISADPLFRRAAVTLLTPNTDGSLLVGTLEEGLFTLRDATATPFATEADSFLKAKKITRGLRLRDGSLALATASSGLVVLNSDGRFRTRVDETTELQHERILDLFQDREGVLWLCLNSGITRVEIASPLSIFDAANGLKRVTVRDILRFGGVPYFAAADSLYRILPAQPADAQPARGERLPDTESEWWSLAAHPAGLLAGGSGGIVQFAADTSTRTIVSKESTLVLRRSHIDPERVFFGTRNGLRSARRQDTGEWKDEGVIAGTPGEIRTIVESARGDLWLGTPISGIFRVSFAPAAAGERGAATVTPFYETHGLPRGQHWTRVIEWNNGEPRFATQAGLYRFDEATQSFHAVTEFGARFADASFKLGNVAPDSAGDLWLAGRRADGVWLDQEVGRAFHGAGKFDALPYKVADKVGEIEKIYPESDDARGAVVWIGGTEGAIRVDVAQLEEAAGAPPFAAVIRRAISSGKETSPGVAQAITSEALPYARNSVRFEFAANTYRIGTNLRYQTRVVGFQGGSWSELSERTTADYTNLPEGSYAFEVRAQDIDGRMSMTTTLPFAISPPWHRTLLAYAMYAVLIIAALGAAARWQLGRFQRQKAKLESLIAARTGELRAREAELVSAKEAADSANRAKSAFLANMSHELRTPLNAILGYTQILLKDDGQSAKNRERLSVVDQSGNHLLTMINEVLDLSKIEAGKLAVNPTDFPLVEVIDDVCAAFRQRVAEKGIQFECGCAPGVDRVVHSDAGKLRQVLFNLLGNAVKFTDRGRVTLDVVPLGPDRVRFAVKDTGVGIAASDLRDIFLTFHQAGKAASGGQGTGLGLAISERLVQLLGGHLQVESELGNGSRFWFELELPEVAPAAELSTAPAARSAAPHLSPIGFRGPPRRILIADDHPTNRNVLRELLQPLGFQIEEAVDGPDCLQRCATNPPEALLLDLQMPGINGFEVARALRRNLPGGSLKIIAVSASVFADAREQAVEAGCDDFLPKPFREQQLLDVIGRALSVEWTFPEASQPFEAAAAGASNSVASTPPAEEIDAMLELSRRGDILGIKKRLAALATLNQGGYAAFVQALEPFVASYQMNRIRDALLKLRQETA